MFGTNPQNVVFYKLKKKSPNPMSLHLQAHFHLSHNYNTISSSTSINPHELLNLDLVSSLHLFWALGFLTDHVDQLKQDQHWCNNPWSTTSKTSDTWSHIGTCSTLPSVVETTTAALSASSQTDGESSLGIAKGYEPMLTFAFYWILLEIELSEDDVLYVKID